MWCIIFTSVIPPCQFFSHTFPAGTHHLHPTHLLLSCLFYPLPLCSSPRKFLPSGHGPCLLLVETLFCAVSNKGWEPHRPCCCCYINTTVSVYSEGISILFFKSFKSIPKRNHKFCLKRWYLPCKPITSNKIIKMLNNWKRALCIYCH